MRKALAITVIALITAGCGMGSPADKTAQGGQSGAGVLSRMRPKASEQTIEELKEQEARAREEQIKLAQAAARQQQGANLNGLGRVLPPVSTDPIAPPADAVAADGPVVNNYNPLAGGNGAALAAQTNDKNSGKIDSKALTPAKDAMLPGTPPAPEAASYSQQYMSTSVPPPPPGALNGGQLVPPPPAVTLSTNANIAYGGNDNPYANPYLNPYAVPYQQYPQYPYMMPPPQQAPPQEPQRPAGLFGSGKKKPRVEDSADDDDDSAKPAESAKKQSDFVPIRPVGMEARSPYKQKDDLKILWNGAINTYQMQRAIGKDEELESLLKRIDVGLPPDATKGMFTVPPRRVASIFRPLASEKKSVEEIRKIQFDLVQAYYRYLYAYHKYALQQQTVAARKQEIEVAASNAEKQRAEADLARAQDAAQSATEDMRSAQEELAAVAGAQSARSVIGRVSGITPSIQTLAQAEKSAQPIEVDSKSGSGVFGLGKIFFGGGKKSDAPASASLQDDAGPAVKADAGAAKKVATKEKGGLSLFGHGKPKEKKGKASKSDDDDDLAPAESAPKSRPVARAPRSDAGMPPASPSQRPAISSPISFELRDVEITARKSILTVSVRNAGSEAFRLTPDVVSIAEGDKKVSEAAMRAEFDSTSVKPNGEVKGKITIFGRPWNDRLVVSISDGSNNIQLKRNH